MHDGQLASLSSLGCLVIWPNFHFPIYPFDIKIALTARSNVGFVNRQIKNLCR